MKHEILVFGLLLFGSVYAVEDADYSRMPHLYGLDEYDACLQEVNGIYCVANFDLFGDDGNDVIKLIKEHSKDTIRHYNHSYIERGVCVTRTCKQYIDNNNIKESADLTELLERCINYNIWDKYKVNASLSVLHYCDRHGERVELDAIDWAAAGLFVLLVGLNVIGTCYDVKIRNKNVNDDKEKGNKFVLCFSLFRNLQTLKWSQNDSKQDPLRGLHGIRSIFPVFIIFAHISIQIFVFNKDIQSYEKTYYSIGYYIIYNGLMVVQVFFALSGFMLAYLLQVQSEKSSIEWSRIPKIIVMRWFRLTTPCAVMLAFVVSWARHLGSGPLWKLSMTFGCTGKCRAYWWSHLLYVNNMIPENLSCLIHTWHIAADMQLYIMGLVLHVATRTRGRALALSLLLVLGMLAPTVPVWLYGYDACTMFTPQFFRTLKHEPFQYVHIRGYMNLPCFLLGMTAGYIGHHLQKRGTDLSKSTTMRFLSWMIIPLFIGVIYLASLFILTDLRESVLARMGYAATHRAALGLLFFAWFLGLICRCNDVLRGLLTWRGWMVTSKLSYSVYIVHMIFFYIAIGFRRELTTDTFLDMVPYTVGVLVMSYILAVPMYLMIEAPVNKIIKTIMVEQEHKDKKDI